MLAAIDGDINGGGAGKFQSKIWDKDDGDTIAYDYLKGAPDDADPETLLLRGGSIVIHTAK
ncbi:MAG: hypothetical protein IIB90_17595 [Gemmatimonadetes bacterium]|nr:hypothetical protein [Gemmatimonadota bacterium]